MEGGIKSSTSVMFTADTAILAVVSTMPMPRMIVWGGDPLQGATVVTSMDSLVVTSVALIMGMCINSF